MGSSELAGDPGEARRQLEYTLSRARPKELAHDYLEPEVESRAQVHLDNSPAAVRRRAIEDWKAIRAGQLSAEEIQEQAIERWRAYRAGMELGADRDASEKSAEKTRNRSYGLEDDL